jgi:hypothetical protein
MSITDLLTQLGTKFLNYDPEKKSEDSLLHFYPSDIPSMVKCGAGGFVALAGYQLLKNSVRRNIDASATLVDPCESMNSNPKIRDNLIKLQSYRKIEVTLFGHAVQNIDKLLFLEKVLKSGETRGTQNDKCVAFAYYRLALNRLNMFQMLVLEMLGNEHGKCANILVDEIYSQLQKHLLNIFHLCSDFNPDKILQTAEKEVENVMQRYERKEKHKQQKYFNDQKAYDDYIQSQNMQSYFVQ